MVDLDLRQRVDRAGPGIDFLLAVPNVDQLNAVLLLLGDDVGHDWVGVLALIEEHELGRDARARQLPGLEIVLVLVGHRARQALQVVPHAVRDWQESLAELGVPLVRPAPEIVRGVQPVDVFEVPLLDLEIR